MDNCTCSNGYNIRDGVLSREMRELLLKCAATALSSKLVAAQKDFFAAMVVEAVMMLDDLLPLNMIGIKKVQGGALEVRSRLVLLKCSYHYCLFIQTENNFDKKFI